MELTEQLMEARLRQRSLLTLRADESSVRPIELLSSSPVDKSESSVKINRNNSVSACEKVDRVSHHS